MVGASAASETQRRACSRDRGCLRGGVGGTRCVMSSAPTSTFRVIAGVVRGEGMASALRRASDRVAEALRHAGLRFCGLFAGVLGKVTSGLSQPDGSEPSPHAAGRRRPAGAGRMPSLRAILNVAASSISPRTGGVATQLTSRLHVERTLRSVALLSPGLLELSTPVHHIRSIASFRVTSEFVASDFEAAVREALAITGARAIHLEGTTGRPFGTVLRLRQSGLPVVLSVHDFSLFCKIGRAH